MSMKNRGAFHQKGRNFCQACRSFVEIPIPRVAFTYPLPHMDYLMMDYFFPSLANFKPQIGSTFKTVPF